MDEARLPGVPPRAHTIALPGIAIVLVPCAHDWVATRESRNYRVVRGVLDDSWMAQSFVGCDRDQSFLMPPDIRDWLAEDHLAWFVLDAVAGMNLGGFYGAYRRDGVGRRAYDPAMMVALLLYSYSRGIRSARAIERACREDVACRVIAMLEAPDHATIARFVDRHEAALAELFGQVLGLCDQAGLVRPGVVAIDGTRLAGTRAAALTVILGRSRGRSWRRRRRSMRPRTSFMGTRVVMSCPSSCARGRGGVSSSARPARKSPATTAMLMSRASPSRNQRSSRLSSTPSRSSRGRKAGKVGCVRRAVSASSVAGRRRSRSRAGGSSGCCSPPSGWRTTSTRNWLAMRPTRSSV